MKKMIKTCPVCLKEFPVWICQAHRVFTCSRKCSDIRKTKPDVTNKCAQCSVEFIAKRNPKAPQKFCSRKCAHEGMRKPIPRTCKECGKSFMVTPFRIKDGHGKGTFCSKKCQLQNWNRKSIKAERPSCYRKNAWKVFEKRCHDCGVKDERILIIHHIDGNRKNGVIQNLVPLCQNCHCLRHIALNGDNRVPSHFRRG